MPRDLNMSALTPKRNIIDDIETNHHRTYMISVNNMHLMTGPGIEDGHGVILPRPLEYSKSPNPLPTYTYCPVYCSNYSRKSIRFDEDGVRARQTATSDNSILREMREMTG